jgi:hypothetical protein
VNHISVYAAPYGPSGMHDVHRRGSHNDGAIVMDPPVDEGALAALPVHHGHLLTKRRSARGEAILACR